MFLIEHLEGSLFFDRWGNEKVACLIFALRRLPGTRDIFLVLSLRETLVLGH